MFPCKTLDHEHVQHFVLLDDANLCVRAPRLTYTPPSKSGLHGSPRIFCSALELSRPTLTNVSGVLVFFLSVARLAVHAFGLRLTACSVLSIGAEPSNDFGCSSLGPQGRSLPLTLMPNKTGRTRRNGFVPTEVCTDAKVHPWRAPAARYSLVFYYNSRCRKRRHEHKNNLREYLHLSKRRLFLNTRSVPTYVRGVAVYDQTIHTHAVRRRKLDI